jgi:Rhodopirellula transposase DDE domain
VTPPGVYDIAKNQGWVNVGIDHDTAEFAVDSIRHWWMRMGQPAYPQATELLITADSGGSNSYGRGCGSTNSRSWRMRPGCTSQCATSLRELI